MLARSGLTFLASLFVVVILLGLVLLGLKTSPWPSRISPTSSPQESILIAGLAILILFLYQGFQVLGAALGATASCRSVIPIAVRTARRERKDASERRITDHGEDPRPPRSLSDADSILGSAFPQERAGGRPARMAQYAEKTREPNSRCARAKHAIHDRDLWRMGVGQDHICEILAALPRHDASNTIKPQTAQNSAPFRFVEFSAWPHRTADELWRTPILKSCARSTKRKPRRKGRGARQRG